LIDSTQILGAIQSRLEGSATLTAIVPAARMGNYLDKDAAYPHLLYQIDLESLEAKDGDGQRVEMQIDAWTKYRGSKEAMQIADIVRGLFHGSPLTIASGTGFGCNYLSMDNAIEPDGETYRISMSFTLWFDG
jgi:hypothetical protein